MRERDNDRHREEGGERKRERQRQGETGRDERGTEREREREKQRNKERETTKGTANDECCPHDYISMHFTLFDMVVLALGRFEFNGVSGILHVTAFCSIGSGLILQQVSHFSSRCLPS